MKMPLLPEQGMNLKEYENEVSKDLISQALLRTGNNKYLAAKLLGLNRTTLVERMRRHGFVIVGRKRTMKAKAQVASPYIGETS
jgi:transcriptional regulator with GAF, ATPase, and Fis domain